MALVANWRSNHTFDNQGLTPEESARAVARDVQDRVLPFVARIQSNEQLLQFLVNDEEPFPWFRSQGLARLAEVAKLEATIGARQSLLDQLASTHKQMLEEQLDGVSLATYTECIRKAARGDAHCCPKQVLALGFAPLEPSFPLWRPICSRIRAIRSRRTVLDSIFEVPSNRFGPQTQSDTGIDGPPRRWSHPQRSWTAPFWLGRRHDLRPGLLERLGAYEARPPPTASTAVLDGNGRRLCALSSHGYFRCPPSPGCLC